MRDHSHHIELSRQDAVDAMLAKLASLDFTAASGLGRRIEQVPLSQAYGRVLARAMRSRTDVPNTLNCAMDSIAVRWEAFEDLDEGELPDTSHWVRGVDWEFANTGTAMPAGFDTAIVVEHVTVSEDEQRVVIDAAPSERFAGTRPQGSVLHRGETVAEAGTLITPDVAARIAGAGRSVVPVVARPRVAFIPTGNELIPPNVPFWPGNPDKYAGWGRTYESNSLVVQGKVEAWGGIYVPFDIVPDNPRAIGCTIDLALEVADIVVLNAGSSKGSDDWSVEALEKRGEIICHQTNHGPGHHSSYAIVEGKPIVGISGPAGGASFTLNFYLRPLMRAFLGLDPAPETVPVRLAEAFPVRRKKDARAGEERPSVAGSVFYGIKFLSVAPDEQGQLWATPINARPGLGASPANAANAYYMLPDGPGIEPPAVGDVIHVEMR